MQSRYKIGSSKQIVWEEFSQQGATAALEKGLALHVSETRLNRWLGRWKKRPARHEATNHKKVFDVGNPDLHGVVIQEGQDVSEIDWENGYTQFIANDMILPVGYFSDKPELRGYVALEKNVPQKCFGDLDTAIRITKKHPTWFLYQVDSKIWLIHRKTWEGLRENHN